MEWCTISYWQHARKFIEEIPHGNFQERSYIIAIRMIVQPRRYRLLTKLKNVGVLEFANDRMLFVANIQGYRTGKARVHGTWFATKPTGGPCRMVRSQQALEPASDFRTALLPTCYKACPVWGTVRLWCLATPPGSQLGFCAQCTALCGSHRRHQHNGSRWGIKL